MGEYFWGHNAEHAQNSHQTLLRQSHMDYYVQKVTILVMERRFGTRVHLHPVLFSKFEKYENASKKSEKKLVRNIRKCRTLV